MNILLLDDDPSLRRSLSTLLTLLGHDVRAVANGTAALEVLREGFSPDVVVSDFDFGEEDPRNGVVICERLRPACSPSTRFIITSALPRAVPNWVLFVSKSSVSDLTAALDAPQ